MAERSEAHPGVDRKKPLTRGASRGLLIVAPSQDVL
ncbi:MAG: hypothetical protein RL447_1040, partial [Bacteroidota bacterium]